jgi:UDP-glucose 4-epimerase
MSKILVTGGAGFIGSHVVKMLLERGHEVTVLDNLTTGKMERLLDVIDKITFVKGDILDENLIKKIIKGFDAVVHLAALISVDESFEKPYLYYLVNSIGTQKLLQRSVEASVDKFVFTSSCAVYGDPIALPIKESHPTNPLSPYAKSKLYAEKYCKLCAEANNIKIITFRLFNVYGPSQDLNPYAGVIAQFAKRIRNGNPPIIYGSGDQTRDFIFVEDVARYITIALETTARGVFNIGSGSSTSIKQLAELILEIMERNDLPPVFAPRRHGDITHSVADISLAIRTFSFKPEIGLKEGLKRTLLQI